jgi:hypothetical protein
MAKHSDASRPRGKGRRGFARASDAASSLLGRVGVRRGFAERKLIAEWRWIVGDDLAASCRPVRMSFRRGEGAFGATLVVEAEGARAHEAQHLSERIVERVNQVYGYRAVSRLKVVQTSPGAGAMDRADTPRRGAATPMDLAPSPLISKVGDDALRLALARLEANVKRRAQDRARD